MSTTRSLLGDPDLREVAVPVATVWTSPTAPRPGLDDAAVAGVPEMAQWVTVLDEDGTQERRLGLHGRTLTQLLLGEPVLVVEHGAEWSKVVAPWQRSGADERGYPGWVRTAHLGTPVDRTAGSTAFVMAPAVTLRISDSAAFDVSCGTALWVDGDDDLDDTTAEHVSVLLPDGRRGTVLRSAVRLSEKKATAAPTPADVLETARRFLGLPYLWGGTSGWGLDCSGLVHLSHRAHGVTLPRDASDQAVADGRLEPVDLDEVEPGDLYFFARPGSRVTHVGFATGPLGDDGARPMLHAPEGGGLIEECPMTPERQATLVSSARLSPRR